MEKCKKVMKRRKKQNEVTPGQLCLFELPGIRQQEEETRRTKPKRKPAAPSKFAALTLMPPTPEPALKQPENALQTKIPEGRKTHLNPRNKWHASGKIRGCRFYPGAPCVVWRYRYPGQPVAQRGQ